MRVVKRDDVRRCNKCNEWKFLDEFAEDPTKTLGRAYTCRTCKQDEDRDRYRKRCDAKRAKKQTTCHMMTDDAFKIFYEDDELKDHINKQAVRYAKTDKARQEDYKQVAWARIALCEPGKSTEKYKRAASQAIYAEYRRNYNMKEYGLGYMETMTAEEYVMWQTGVFK